MDMQEQEFEQLKQKIKACKNSYQFAEACQNITASLDSNSINKDTSDTQHNWLIQQLAICTYKDPDQQPGQRLDKALEILEQLNLSQTDNTETLGIAGAIYKRKFQYSGQQKYLDQALAFYLKGHELPHVDNQESKSSEYDGYNATNAAFLLDLKAHTLSLDPYLKNEKTTDTLHRQASGLREFIVANLPEQSLETWWQKITLAESCFALKQFDLAEKYFQQAIDDPKKDDWEVEISIRQLAHLYNYRNDLKTDPQAKSALHHLIVQVCHLSDTHAEDVLESLITGKIGLALSGGGFRASFYHLGVLAKLADLDLLRKVEVLSCVSGGSIIGAMYYLAVRNKLQSTSQQDLHKSDYIDIVETLTADFTQAVQTNIRTQVFSNPGAIWKMLTSRYTRTDRLAELYEKYLYQGSEKNLTPFNELKIFPENVKEFHPRRDNWKLASKVPALIINAATLNTGNNWQFTADGMGEAPWGLEPEINSTDHLIWREYKDLHDTVYQDYPLAKAVAASSAVPGLFHPVTLPDLYPGHKAQLVDGGVYDNQGMSALLDQGCDIVYVSDGSGQMDTVHSPGTLPVSVGSRSNEILQARLRTAQYKELEAKKDSGLIKEMMYIHLKQDFKPEEIEPAVKEITSSRNEDAQSELPYDMPKEYQRALSAMRTDLDPFSDIEIQALMYSGYKMTECHFQDGPGQQVADSRTEETQNSNQWSFINFPEATRNRKPNVQKHLDTGKHRFFRYLRLSGGFKALAALFVLYLAVLLSRIFPDWSPLLTGLDVIMGIIVLLILITPLLANLHLSVTDKSFLNLGKIPEDSKDKD